MRDLQVRKKRYKFFRSNLFAVILFFFSLFMLRHVFDVYKKNELARINKEEAVKKLENLKNKRQTLESEIERLGTDRGVEEELRKRFQVVKSGEQVMIIVDKSEPAGINKKEEEKGVFESIWSGFLGLLSF